MPVPNYTLYIVKRKAAEEWTNVYNIYADSLPDAELYKDAAVAYELEKHDSSIELVQARLSTYPPGDKSFFIFPINGDGEAENPNGLLPDFCTVRIDIPIPTGGDPLRKYYHFGIDIENGKNGELAPTLQTFYGAGFPVAVLVGGVPVAQYVDPQGNPAGVPSVQRRITHRQFRRGSKKKPLVQS